MSFDKTDKKLSVCCMANDAVSKLCAGQATKTNMNVCWQVNRNLDCSGTPRFMQRILLGDTLWLLCWANENKNKYSDFK